jgi:ATP-dependent Clp protease ATP-binding subunit ClpA
MQKGMSLQLLIERVLLLRVSSALRLAFLSISLAVLSTASATATAEPWKLYSKGNIQLTFDPEKGILSRAHLGAQTNAILNFSNLIDPYEVELSVYPIKGSASLFLVEHGNYLSVVDINTGKLLAENIGPSYRLKKEHRHFIIQAFINPYTGKELVVFDFYAEIKTPSSRVQELRALAIVGASEDPLYIPGRRDLDWSNFVVKFVSESKMQLHAGIDYESSSSSKAVLELDFKKFTGHVKKGTGYFDSDPVREEKSFDLKSFLFHTSGLSQHLVGSRELQNTQWLLPSVLAPSEAILNIERRLKDTRTFADGIKEELSQIKGQRDAIDALLYHARTSGVDTKTSVFLFAGTTGTGKTSLAKLYARASFPEQKEPFFRISLANQSKKEFLQSQLFGSSAGYIGSSDLTKIQSWLLYNPEGGVLLFDEFEKAKPDDVAVLLDVLDSGEIHVQPAQLANIKNRYAKKPIEEWPEALREASINGTLGAGLTLKLTPKHAIILASNAGAEHFTGAVAKAEKGTQSIGRRLKSDQDLKSANERLTEERVKESLRARDFGDEFINRINVFVPFKVILFEDHKEILKDELAKLIDFFGENYALSLTYTEALVDRLALESYSPLDGVRFVQSGVRNWLKKSLEREVIRGKDDRRVSPGDTLQIDVLDQGKKMKPKALVLDLAGQERLSFEFGQFVSPGPRELLKRASERLLPTLERRIVGHPDSKNMIADGVIAGLVEAVMSEDVHGKPIVRLLDGPPGVGKTESAKAVAEALFEDPESLLKIAMNEIITLQDYQTSFLDRLAAQMTSSPEHLVVLLDELPRVGEGGHKTQIFNSMMSLFDEGEFKDSKGEKFRLPKASVFLATGNIFVDAMGDSATIDEMNQEMFLARSRLVMRHPRYIHEAYAKAVPNVAFRRRLGDLIISLPLESKDLEELVVRYVKKENHRLQELYGVRVAVDESFNKYLWENYVPARGFPWFAEKYEKLVFSPLIRRLQLDEVEGVKEQISVSFDASTLSVMAQLGNKEMILGKGTLKGAGRHPRAIARGQDRVNRHEAAHAVIQLAMYGPRAVMEINTFAPNSGWMEKAFDIPGKEPLTNVEQVIKDMTVSLAGRAAEMLFVESGPSNGASSDNQTALAIFKDAYINGATYREAPPVVRRDPKTNEQSFVSEEDEKEFVAHTAAALLFAQRLAEETLKKNLSAHKAIVQGLENSETRSLNRKEVMELTRGKIRPLTEQEILKIAKSDLNVQKTCQELLFPASKSADLEYGLWEKVQNFFFRK